MNKLGIFMNFWEKNWDADHAKYIKKAAAIGYDVLEFQAQPLLEMSDEKLRSLKAESVRQSMINRLSFFVPKFNTRG